MLNKYMQCLILILPQIVCIHAFIVSLIASHSHAPNVLVEVYE